MQSRNVNYTTRCAPSKFFDFTNEVKLKDEHIKAIADTPFKEFMRFPRLPVQRTFLNSILDRWDNASNCFILGGKRVFIKPQDIVVILGLSMRGEYIDLKKKLDDCDKKLKDKYFPNVLLSRNLMEENIKKLLEQSLEESLPDFTKLFILYIFNTILFPNASQTTPKFLLHYVNNLEKMHSYAWATAVYEFLVRSISEGAKKKKGYVNGCVMILEPWLHEHIILQPGLTTKMVYPRLLRWVGNNYQQAGTHKKYINSLIHTQVTEDITLTNEEKILLPPDKSNMVEEIRRYLEPILLRIEEKIDTMLALPTQLQKLRSEEKKRSREEEKATAKAARMKSTADTDTSSSSSESRECKCKEAVVNTSRLRSIAAAKAALMKSVADTDTTSSSTESSESECEDLVNMSCLSSTSIAGLKTDQPQAILADASTSTSSVSTQ